MADTVTTQDSNTNQIPDELDAAFQAEVKYHVRHLRALHYGTTSVYKTMKWAIDEKLKSLYGPDEIVCLFDQMEDRIELIENAIANRENDKLPE